MQPSERDAFALALHTELLKRSERLWHEAMQLAGLLDVLAEVRVRWGDGH